MPQYQVSHTLVPGALEAASAGVPPVMYQPRNPYASAAYVESGNGVSPLIGYPSQYPHVIHYTSRPVPASIYEPIPTYADAMSLVRALSPSEPPRSVIGSIPSSASSRPAAPAAAPAAKPSPSQPAAPKPAEPAPMAAPAQTSPEFKPDPDNAGGGGGGGGVGPEPVASPMPNLFRGYVNPNYPDVAPKAPRLQEILTMPFSEWPEAFSRWWNNRDTPSSAFAGSEAPSTRSSYWDTMDAQNTARRALGLDEVAGPSRPTNPSAQRPAMPAELTTPPDLMAKLQAQGTVVPQAYNNVDNSLNRYWAQFFANQFAKRGPLEGQNLQDYLTQAQNLGFYDEALQYLGR